MKSHLYLLQTGNLFADYQFALLCFFSAFVIALIAIPPVISFIHKYKLFDRPNARKVHTVPVPTMGGIAITAGLLGSLFLWFPFSPTTGQISFFFSVLALLALGILDDLKDLAASYKFFVQVALAALIAVSGIRITSFEGLFGIAELPMMAQYTFTIVAVVGIVNAFNLIDGIDGLAGGLGFMSLIALGLLLTMSGDANTALIAFAMAGAILAFLYFNLNPAKIFMGDTGSLVLGFVSAVLCIRLMQVNAGSVSPVIPQSPVYVLGIVIIPVFDTIRVFATRLWNGKSPFEADKTHIHHLLTNHGFSHAFSARFICFINGFILLELNWIKQMPQEWILLILAVTMLSVIFFLKNMGWLKGMLHKPGVWKGE
jgi:UDP-GlcNAc:undecaprenyl-phosphate/decaprenyl-phosphate GlcNAc-1-phosphate transferase